jgi:transmembrane protein EpsG
MMYESTYFFYLAVVLITLLFTWYSEKTGKKRGIIVAVLILVCVSGLRAHTVGIDTMLYKYGVEYFHETGTVSWKYNFSLGYGLFSNVVLTVCEDYSFLLFVEAAITNILIVARFWDFRNQASMTMMMLVYICTTYFMTMNIICQYLAVAVVFYFSRYIDRGKPIPFFIAVVLASCIHLSAAVGILFWAVRLLNFKNVRPARFFAQLLAICLVVLIVFFIAQMFFARYSGYNNSKRASSVGLMVFAQIFVFLFSLLACGYFSKGSRKDKHSIRVIFKEKVPYGLLLYSIGILLSAASYVINNAGRIAYYFLIYGPVCFGVMAKGFSKHKSRFFCSLTLFVWFVLYAIYSFFLTDRLGIIPYAFLWG